MAFERLEINKEFHPFISGPNGAVAKRISEETGARINIPPLSLMKNEMSVAGDKDSVAKAVAEIQKIHSTMVKGRREGNSSYNCSHSLCGRCFSSLPLSSSLPFSITSFLFQKRTISSVSVEVRKSQHKYVVGPRGGGLHVSTLLCTNPQKWEHLTIQGYFNGVQNRLIILFSSFCLFRRY